MNPTLILLLLFCGVFAIAQVIWGIIQFFMQDQIRQNGVHVEGRIIEHIKLSSRAGPAYYLKYSYEYQGTTYNGKQKVSKATYRLYFDGAGASVCCLPDNPTRSLLYEIEEVGPT